MGGIGMLEAFDLAEQFGDKALTVDDLLFMADARKKKGCQTVRSMLTPDDRRRVMKLGMKCKEWKEQNR